MAEDKTETPVVEEKEQAVAEAPAEVTTENTETTDTPVAEEGKPEAKPRKKRNKRTVASGQIHVLASFNNTIITVTDEKGNTLTTASAGASGFRGSKKGTAYAAQVAAEKAVSSAKQNYGLTKADVFVKGVGLGRDAAVRTLAAQKVQIDNIKDVTGIPHGGVRPRKAKRN